MRETKAPNITKPGLDLVKSPTAGSEQPTPNNIEASYTGHYQRAWYSTHTADPRPDPGQSYTTGAKPKKWTKKLLELDTGAHVSDTKWKALLLAPTDL